ncbi:MAG: Ig domain-containing protein [Lachnospiraceae bacterium]|nr:Ig domain-containing protein [Lachnospiraceae bacterium]
MKRRIIGFLMALILIVICIPGTESSFAAGIKLNKKSAELKIGETLQLKLKGAAGAITWSSSDTKLATVSEDGLVTAKKAGDVSIKAAFSGKKYTCKITIAAAKLNYKKYELKEGTMFTLKLKGTEAASFKSSDTNVVKVTKTGSVTAVTIGKAVITVKDKAGNKYKCKVSVVYNEESHIHTNAYKSAKKPTCTETGLTKGEYCTTCGAVIVPQEVIPAKGHSYGEDGICTVCGEKDPNYTPPHEHHLINISKEPTCTEDGYTEKVYCDLCGEVIIAPKTIKALGHDYQNGFCARCHEPEIHEYIVEKAINPTCTEPGRTEFIYCRFCGDVKQYAEEIPPLGHEYNGGPTCIRCGADKYGHIHTWVIQKPVAATCTEPGFTEGKYCSSCGYIAYAPQFTPALHHNFVNGKCTRCGVAENIIEKKYFCLLFYNLYDIIPPCDILFSLLP